MSDRPDIGAVKSIKIGVLTETIRMARLLLYLSGGARCFRFDIGRLPAVAES
jgi:hypothetical protein